MADFTFTSQDKCCQKAIGKPISVGQLSRKYLLNPCPAGFEDHLAQIISISAAANEKEDEVGWYSGEFITVAEAKRRRMGLIRFIGKLSH